MNIHFAETNEHLERCYPALKELRPDLMEASYMETMKIMMSEGVKVVMLEAENNVPTVACFRVAHYLFRGKNLYIDDLITLPEFRKKGYSSALLKWIKDYGAEQDCDSMSLDSGIQRRDAHRLYLSVGFYISSLHFSMKLKDEAV